VHRLTGNMDDVDLDQAFPQKRVKVSQSSIESNRHNPKTSSANSFAALHYRSRSIFSDKSAPSELGDIDVQELPSSEWYESMDQGDTIDENPASQKQPTHSLPSPWDKVRSDIHKQVLV
jgi:hypothetical protein